VVDLDATLGLGSNSSVVKNIIGSVSVPVQVGGGIRSEDRARDLLNEGASRIVIGTLAFRDEESLARLIGEYGVKRVVVALDFSNGKVVTDGWTKRTTVAVEQALARFCGLGARWFLVTAVERDGMLEGPDFKTYLHLTARGDVNVMASGGIHSVADLVELDRLGVAGVVVGKALYDGLVTLEEVNRVVAAKASRE
jgi:phosphoribosylformimino-5-aminoimidazole carboxamide ribotide isomerase